MSTLDSREELKRLAAERAMQYVIDGEVIGVGTGSTVRWFIEALGRERDRIQGAVSSSEQSTRLLREPFGTRRVLAASVVALGVVLLQISRAA